MNKGMGKRLPRSFFRESTPQVAKNLLGCVLVRETAQEGRIAGIITETEAYTEEDEAAHSFGGKVTLRNRVMFEDAGHLYVYFTYGMHYCMNVVSEAEGRGCAVLIRSVEPTHGTDIIRRNRGGRKDCELTDGPGKICQAFGITAKHNGIDMIKERSPLFLLEGGGYVSGFKAMPRIGISKAKNTLWRFVMC